jgi:hypothetical protein
LDKNGNLVEQRTFQFGVDKEGKEVGERMRLVWFCWSKSFFDGLSCSPVTNTVFSQQKAVENKLTPEISYAGGGVRNQPVVENSEAKPSVGSANPQSQQVIYQIIEKAVPGPQGPAGRDGKDGTSVASQFLSQYSAGSEYNGFGISTNNAADPTGNANLSTISGAGLSSCNSTTSKIVYNSTTTLFECATDQGGSGSSALPANATFTLATITYATATSFFSGSASFTQATSTNFFSAAFSSLASIITNLLFTNATGTNATTTNLATTNFLTSGFSILPSIYGTNATFTTATITNTYSTNILSTNATLTNATITYLNVTNFSPNEIVVNTSTITSATNTNLYSQNASFTGLVADKATFSYATVTNGFFTNLSVTGPVQAALTNGYVFRGGTNNYSEATSTIFVANSGKVGVGSTTPSEKLSVQGNLLVSGNIVSPFFSNLNDANAGSDQILCIKTTGEVVKDSLGGQNCFLNYSDERLKKNIVSVDGILEKVRQLKTVNFNWIDESRGTSTQLGYIAQDVQKVFPEVVVQDKNGFFKVNYVSLSAIYTNAIKELIDLLDSKVDFLLNRITKNEEEILNLKTRVDNLESVLGVPKTQVVSTPTTPEEKETDPIAETQPLPEPTLEVPLEPTN